MDQHPAPRPAEGRHRRARLLSWWWPRLELDTLVGEATAQELEALRRWLRQPVRECAYIPPRRIVVLPRQHPAPDPPVTNLTAVPRQDASRGLLRSTSSSLGADSGIAGEPILAGVVEVHHSIDACGDHEYVTGGWPK